MDMQFLKDFEKQASKLEGVTDSSEPPRYWHSFGNYVMNYIMSGNFKQGIPQGRVTGLAGPSGAGKSFVMGNLIKNAQADGAYVFVIDSENALDNDYMMKIGVNVHDNYKYKSVTTYSQVTKLVSAFIKGYTAEYGCREDAPQVVIAIDSISMLQTDTESEDYDKGIIKGGMGQEQKIAKKMLKNFVQDIKGKNIAMVCSTQVYKNQDVLNGEGLFIVAESFRYAMSQIALLTKLKLKGDEAGSFEGIKMKCQGFKTRFTKPFQTITLEVPYSTGIDKYSGLLDAAVTIGTVIRSGNSFYLKGADESTKKAARFLTDDWYDNLVDILSKDTTLSLTTDAVEDKVQLDPK